MHSLAVIKHTDVLQDILLSSMATLVVTPMHSLLFQCAEEALYNGIVPAITFSTHATCYLVLRQ
tara:strand:- start:729 stop:920 length:192 start_codon:yes stop_codon:yes gene_type:complete